MLEVDIAGQRGAFEYAVRFFSDAKVTALFGVSGAGKSTIIDAISGIIRPENGKIVVGETVFFDASSRLNLAVRRRRVGHIFQESRLFPHLSVQQNLTYGRWAGRRSRQAASFGDVVALLGLEALLKRRPDSLSGGERQRVAIGRALLSDPRVLLMDEPLAGLDFQRKSEIMPYLRLLADESGVPVVFVSHHLDEVAELADYLVLMARGRVVEAGLIGDVLPKVEGAFDFQRHAPNSLLRAFYQAGDAVYGLSYLLVGTQRLVVPQVVSASHQAYRIRVAANDVVLARQAPAQTSFQNCLSGYVLALQDGDRAFCDVTVSVDGQPLVARLTRKACDDMALAPGLGLYVLIKAVSIDRPAFD